MYLPLSGEEAADVQNNNSNTFLSSRSLYKTNQKYCEEQKSQEHKSKPEEKNPPQPEALKGMTILSNNLLLLFF